MAKGKFLVLFLTLLLGIFTVAWAQNTLIVGEDQTYTTIQAAITAAIDGDNILVQDGTYTGNVTINKNITLTSVNGSAVTIIDGLNSGGGPGTIHLTAGRNGVVVGTTGHGFTVKGIDGPASIEYSAIYMTGAQTNITIEGNIIEARGDAALMGEYDAANTNVVINNNVITGKTFNGDNPAGVGFNAQNTLLNVPRQLVVFGGGSGTTNTQNFTFTNNVLSGICGGMSITDNSGNPIAPTPQGNTLASLEFAGIGNVISGNTFSGTTTRYAEALRMRGPGSYTFSGNVFNGSYPVVATAATTTASIGVTRINDLYTSSTFSGNNVVVLSAGNIAVAAIYTKINDAIAYASAGQVVSVGIGTYNENVLINKSITLHGSGVNTVVVGVTGVSGGNTIQIAASNVTVENLSVTRSGNNVTEWNSALNGQGILFNQGITGGLVQNCYIYGNRTGVYLNTTQSHIVRNNIITNNRTGIQLVSNVSNCLIENNEITNNWTLGIIIYNGGNTGSSTNVLVRNNNISGNWYSQAECKTVMNPDPFPDDRYNFVSNWFGSAVLNVTNAGAGEPGYADQIPVEFGGTAVSPGTNDGKISGDLYFKILYDPWYMDAAMTRTSDQNVQNTDTGEWFTTIQAAIDDADTIAGHTIQVGPGTYNEALTITKGITLESVGTAQETIINCPVGSLTRGVWINANIGTFIMDGFTVQGFTEGGIIQGMSAATGTTCQILNNIVISNGVYLRNGIQVTGNNSIVRGNTVYGAPLTEEWASSGIIVVNGSGIVVDANHVYSSDAGISVLNYTGGTTPMSDITITGNTLVGNAWSLEVTGWYYTATPPATYYLFDGVTITGNTISNSENVALSAYFCVISDLTISGNTFTDNPIHVENGSETTLDMNAIYAANTYSQYYILDQTIYGNGAALYVDVPDEVIPNSYNQTYAVTATSIANLRGYTVKVTIPKADFPTAPVLAIGPEFLTQGDNYFFLPMDESTTTDWIYNVSGSYMGGYAGITGTDVVLFTINATSAPDPYSNVSAGCYIEIDFDSVVLKDDQNPYHVIPCFGTLDGWVLIDSADPLVVIDNAASFTPMPYLIPYAGTGLVAPVFNLTYTDDWDLATAMYLIQGEGLDAPLPAAFTSTVGTVNGTSTTIPAWTLPITGLADGTYTVYLLVTDEAGHTYILDWDFIIDNTAPAALGMTLCRTTPNADISVDLGWTYDALNPPVSVNVWALDYALTPNAHAYPEYDPTDLNPTITNDIDPYTAGPSTLGWVKVAEIPVASQITVNTLGTIAIIDGVSLNIDEWLTMTRGYFYFTIYGEAANGQMSAPVAAPFYRESISYWPGDVVTTLGAVNPDDIALLSTNWGLTPGDPIVDVGPSTDYARRSRPMPDNLIDIEDLMMFSMNYNNTDYEYYPRNFPQAEPITIAMTAQSQADQLTVSLELGGNTGFVKGLDLPLAYGSGLRLISVSSGSVWPEGSLVLHTDRDGVVTVSGATLGADLIVDGNGTVVTLTFAVTGAETGLELRRMIARTHDNHEIEIVNNPTGNVDNDDLVNVIPESSYLGGSYPNPFRGSTTLTYGVKEAGGVKVNVFNSRGQLIRSLVNDSKAPGTYQIVWDGRDSSGQPASSGIYFFRMETKGLVKTHKALMLK